ncbi:MAG: hypothetical protein AB2L24_06885 [Mangrovibacterium sp.]
MNPETRRRGNQAKRIKADSQKQEIRAAQSKAKSKSMQEAGG